MERLDAQSALGAIGDAQVQLANALECPPWRHALFGLIMSLLVLGLALEFPLQIGTLVIAMGLMVVTVVSDRRRMGVFANGYRRGATLPVAIGLLIVSMLLIAAQIRLREAGASIGVGVATAGAEFVVATLASMLWQRRFRAEMLKGRA